MKSTQAIVRRLNMDAAYAEANSTLPDTLPYITVEEAQRAYKRLVRKFGKAKDAAPNTTYDMRVRKHVTYSYNKNGDVKNRKVQIHVRRCWICISGDPSTLHRGWRRLIHDVSHRIWRYRSPGLPDHCTLHAEFEAKLVKYVNASGWLQGSLKSKPKKVLSQEEKKENKKKNLIALIKRWETKNRLTQTYLKKYKQRLKRMVA